MKTSIVLSIIGLLCLSIFANSCKSYDENNNKEYEYKSLKLKIKSDPDYLDYIYNREEITKMIVRREYDPKLMSNALKICKGSIEKVNECIKSQSEALKKVIEFREKSKLSFQKFNIKFPQYQKFNSKEQYEIYLECSNVVDYKEIINNENIKM
jgi:hypothetical protein